MIRKKKGKRKMRIKIAHVLTKKFQVPIKREMCSKEHSRIRLTTLYIHLMFRTCAHLDLIA